MQHRKLANRLRDFQKAKKPNAAKVAEAKRMLAVLKKKIQAAKERWRDPCAKREVLLDAAASCHLNAVAVTMVSIGRI